MGAGDHEIELKLRFDDEAVAERLRALLDPGGVIPPIRQTNAFFDRALTADEHMERARAGLPSARFCLRAASTALRLRREDVPGEAPRFLLTLKGRATPPAALDPWRPDTAAATVLTRRPEEEITLEAADAEAVLAGHKDPLALFAAYGHASPLVEAAAAALGPASARLVGQFINDRWPLPYEVPLPDGLYPVELELDRTELPGGEVHHELELELDDGNVAEAEAVEAALTALLEQCGGRPFPSVGKASRFFATVA